MRAQHGLPATASRESDSEGPLEISTTPCRRHTFSPIFRWEVRLCLLDSREMIGWPQVTEPLLRERQGMSNEQFLKFLAKLLEAIGTRELDDEHYERAIGYPWERRPGSCLVTEKGVEDLKGMEAERRNELIHMYVYESANRV